MQRRLVDFLLWKLRLKRDPQLIDRAPADFTFPFEMPEFDPMRPWAVWINHSTFLISIDGKHLLTDPIWSQRCSPVAFIGPRRRHAPAISMEELPKIDYVLISHDHYDHLDKATVLKLHERFPEAIWIVPKHVANWFQKQQMTKLIELDWWEKIDLASKLTITAVPAKHFSGRTAGQLDSTLWSGYVMQHHLLQKKCYFAGDTGYDPNYFKEIAARFNSMDLSLLPIGAYLPRWFMSSIHVSPEEAVKIHQEVQSKLSLAMHWKTFKLADEPLQQPPYELFKALQKQAISPTSFIAIEPGIKVNW